MSARPRKRRPGAPRRGPLRDEDHKRWVSRHFCCTCYTHSEPGDLNTESVSQAAHTSHNGMSSKGGDDTVVPLCPECHTAYDRNHDEFEFRRGVNLREKAKEYRAASPFNRERGVA